MREAREDRLQSLRERRGREDSGDPGEIRSVHRSKEGCASPFVGDDLDSGVL